MAQLMDYVEYLSKEIGPRPAGTEEEQQAALYITEQIQKETGFAANIEEFSGSTGSELGKVILMAVAIVVTILAMLLSVLAIPAFILVAAAAVIYALEAFDRPIISQFLSRGASQNVVAKYQPNFEGTEASKPRGRTRKIVLIAHYDSGRVTPALVSRAESLGLPLPIICLGAIVALAFFALLRIFIAPGGGMGLLVLNVLSIIAILLCALPIVRVLLVRNAPYNEGANNNASGTAALIEVARRISRGSVSEADLAQNAEDDEIYIHGEDAAREAGLIPEGAQIRYEAEQIKPPNLGEYDEEERLLSAKAAIAALTGKPVERRVYGSVANNLVNSFASEGEAGFITPEGQLLEGATADVANAAGAPAAAQQVLPAEAEGFQNAPSWFISAQQNAKRPDGDSASVQIQRSKYTEAMENAERERADRAEEARALEQARREAELRAREQEMRAALDAGMQAAPASLGQPLPADQIEVAPQPEADGQPGFIGQYEPAQADSASAMPANAAPDSTIAMAAPIPAAEIFAEMTAEEASQPEAQPEESASQRRRIIDEIPSVSQEAQEAPSARSRISNLPSINADAPAGASSAKPVTSPSRSGLLRKLRQDVPSLSGLINPVGKDEQTKGNAKPDAASSKRAAARKAAASNVPSVMNVPSPADDPEPALEPVDYNMEVPRTRSGSLLGRLHARNSVSDMSDTPQEWLNVDSDFEARNVGRERGSWESFRDDQYFDDDFDDFATDDNRPVRRRWNGGAYSRMQLGHVDTRSGVDSEADIAVVETPAEDEPGRQLTGEIEQIYHFRNPQFNTEIWFVAVGSDGEGHEGVRAFIDEHADELRGSMVIEIESLGAGALSVASEEGRVRKLTASSRVKRYTRNAVAATGIGLEEVSLAGTDSIASVVQRAGYQSMHLFGSEDGRPALKGSADDIMENMDEFLFDDHVNFVFELLKY